MAKFIWMFDFCVYLCNRYPERGSVVQLVRIHACHAWGRGLESRPDRKKPPQVIVGAFAFISSYPSPSGCPGGIAAFPLRRQNGRPCPLDPGDLAPMSGRNRETEENADTVPSAENGKARFEQPLPIHLEKKTFPAHKSLARLFKHTTINSKNLSKKKKTRKEDKVSPEGPQRAYLPPCFQKPHSATKPTKALSPHRGVVLTCNKTSSFSARSAPPRGSVHNAIALSVWQEKPCILFLF